MIPQDILESNRDLTPGERRHIKQFAQATDVKLKTVREALAKLRQEETELLKTEKNCQLALSPIRMLPGDVISMIFLECGRGEEWPSMTRRDVPCLLTRICSDFRRIALSMPMLWATIAISFPEIGADKEHECSEHQYVEERQEERIDNFRKYMRSRVLAIREWIRRSGTVPLSIKCTSWMESDMLKLFKKEQKALAKVLLPSASRWSHLSLSWEECGPLFIQILELTPDEVPILTNLQISYKGDEEDFSGDIFRAPKLTELSLKGYLNAAKYHVNWAQLTRLTLNLDVSGSVAEILRQAKNLVHLSLIRAETDDDIDDICLPHLRELQLRELYRRGLTVWKLQEPLGDILLVAAYIHAPALETLYADHGVILLTNLVKRSPHLRNLDIQLHDPTTTTKLGAWLRNCPQITSLVINAGCDFWWLPGDPTGLLEELVLDHEGIYTCPNLRIFYCASNLTTPFDVLCQFLGDKHSRSGTVSPPTWERVYLRVSITDWESKDKNGEVLGEVIKKLKSTGVLQLYIKNPGARSLGI